MKFDLSKIEKRPSLHKAWENLTHEINMLKLVKFRPKVVRALQDALNGIELGLNHEAPVVGAGVVSRETDTAPQKSESGVGKDDKKKVTKKATKKKTTKATKKD